MTTAPMLRLLSRLELRLDAALLCGLLVCSVALGAEPSPDVSALRAKAKAGKLEAQAELGIRLLMADGTGRDVPEALQWLRRAADRGNADAQSSLGLMYSFGQGVKIDTVEGLHWLRLAAAQGLAGAQYWLGDAYQRGRGVAIDAQEAARWYRLAADQGDAPAEHSVGLLYKHGEGVPASDTEALRWFKAAADQNLDAAQYDLGLMSLEGRGGAPDLVDATRWFRLAADQGFPSAQIELGTSYEQGRGEQKDNFCAYVWYSLAAAQRNDEGERLRNRLAPQMTAAQTIEARRMLAASDQTERPFIRRPLCPAERITLHLTSSALDDVVHIFEHLTGLAFDLPKGAGEARVRIDAEEVPWEEALTQALRSAGYGWTREGATVHVQATSKAAAGKQRG